MFELTNEQRRCFALATVHEEWELNLYKIGG